jgi:Spherulation-specific family 4
MEHTRTAECRACGFGRDVAQHKGEKKMKGRRMGLGMTLSLLGATALAVAASSPGLANAQSQPSHSQASQGHASQAQLIPLYDNGNPANWTQACSQTNGSGGGSWIIADIAAGQGPGSASVPAWAKVIDNCYNYGRASVIGYVWTDYGEGGQASIASIESQVNAWYSFYPGGIAGIFFDGVSDNVPGTTTSNQSFYRTLASYVHTHEGNNNEVVFNFGANPGSDWMLKSSDANNADIVVTFEGSYDTPGEDPYTSWTQAAWESHYPASDFAALIYNAPGEATAPQPAAACSSLAQQNIRYVYVGTWYDHLPPYFGSFLADALQGNC